MKRKIAALLLCAALTASLAACGDTTGKEAEASASASVSSASVSESSEEAADSSSAEGSADEFSADPLQEDPDSTYAKLLSVPVTEEEYHVEDCITLGDYKGIRLTKQIPEVTDEMVEEELRSLATTEAVDKVEKGDTVNIDYVGTMDGKAFDGGTAEGQTLEIGSGLFIEGFEEGLIGAKTGDVVELNLTFPENYYEELAGKDVLFTVTVNSITRPAKQDDAWVKEYTSGSFDTVEAYKGSLRERLEKEQEENADSVLRQNVWSAVQDASEYHQLPVGYYNEGVEAYEANYAAAAQQNGFEDVDAYIESLKDYGVTKETYEQQKDQYARFMAGSTVLLDALAEAEGLDEEDEGYKEHLKELEEMYGMDEAGLVEMSSEHNVYLYCMTQLVIDRLLADAEVTTETIPAQG